MLLNILQIKEHECLLLFTKKLQHLLKCQKKVNLSMCVHWSVKNSGLLFDPTRDVYPLEMFTTDHLFIKRFGHHHQFQQWNIIVMYPWCRKKGHGYYNIECKGEKTKKIIIILSPDSENRIVTNDIKYNVILNSKQRRSIWNSNMWYNITLSFSLESAFLLPVTDNCGFFCILVVSFLKTVLSVKYAENL